MSTSFWQDSVIYVRRICEFNKTDCVVYAAWIGLMYGLFGVITTFLMMGAFHGVNYPAYVWNIPLGVFVFSTAIAFDTNGHRTINKEVLKKAEALVHHITIFAGITSTMMLCLAYTYPVFMRVPTFVMLFLSVLYSIIDEAMHWHRYLTGHSDRVEMWSHFFIFVGHMIMIGSWWIWFENGYPGVAETLQIQNQIWGF